LFWSGGMETKKNVRKWGTQVVEGRTGGIVLGDLANAKHRGTSRRGRGVGREGTLTKYYE